MKMRDMDKCFENRGFEVTRSYLKGSDSKTGYYKFTITKNGRSVSCEYHWPSDQYDFVERMTDMYNSMFGRNDAIARMSPQRYGTKCQLVNLTIERVIFNDPATIVFWTDGSKTVVKCNNEDFDPEKGLAMAISKKALGNMGNYYNTFTKWLPKENKEDKEDADVNLTFKINLPNISDLMRDMRDMREAFRNFNRRYLD